MMANHCLGARSLASVADAGSHRKLAKAIADCGWGEFLRQLQYKCGWHDRDLGAIDRWFPSSKRCNRCGHILDKLSLEIREWQCPSCNKINQRYYNAALNILAVGTRVGVRRKGTPTKRAVGQTVLASGLSSDGDITSVGLVNLG